MILREWKVCLVLCISLTHKPNLEWTKKGGKKEEKGIAFEKLKWHKPNPKCHKLNLVLFMS